MLWHRTRLFLRSFVPINPIEIPILRLDLHLRSTYSQTFVKLHKYGTRRQTSVDFTTQNASAEAIAGRAVATCGSSTIISNTPSCDATNNLYFLP